MAFEEIISKGGMDVGMEGDRGLVAGRSQREKRRSYKDLLREEEEMAAQVRKTSKKRPKDSELFLLGGDGHKKKKKQSDDFYYRDHDGTGQPAHKKKRKSSDRSPQLSSLPPPPSSLSSSSSNATDTAMGLLQAITSPLATGTAPSPHMNKKPSYPSLSSKDRKHGSTSGGGNSKGGHSSHSRPASSSSSSSKKHSSSSSKSSLFHGGSGKEEPLALREADGLKVKLLVSPESEGFPAPGPPPPPPHGAKGPSRKEKERGGERSGGPGKTKKKASAREPLPIVGKEVEVEGHYGGGMGDDSSSSGGELEAGELVIDDSYTHLSKKKSKKSKKSKKRKDKDKERDKEKSGKERKHSKTSGSDVSRGHGHGHPTVSHSAVGPMYAMNAPLPPHPHHPHHQPPGEAPPEKKKKEKEKHGKDKDKPKKKNTTAYQVFCKEYRVNINAEQPGLVFGELSKRLAEVWKAMPEKDKLVWRQKAQYLQHKQNKAEATTVKRSASTDTKSRGALKSAGGAAGLGSPPRGSAAGLSLSPARIPEVDPIDAAAHLQLLGESLSLIGHRLQETEGMVAVSGSLSVLLDSILCALGPLTCLTAQIPQLNGCPRNVLSNTLDNVAYIMPGL
ncbi:unnamed protein product [Boreogadus saida]